MIERKLWNGQTIPALGLGTWAIGGAFYSGTTALGWGEVDDAESTRAIERGVDLGIRFFDTANVYGGGRSEEVLGRVVGNRSDVVIATKFGGNVHPVTKQAGDANVTPAGIAGAIEESLRRPRREKIDRLPHCGAGRGERRCASEGPLVIRNHGRD